MKVQTFQSELKGEIVLFIDDYKLNLNIENNNFFANYEFLKEYDKKLTDVNPKLFELMVWLLLYNLDTIEFSEPYKVKKTNKHLVSYSGGADSTALLSMFGGIPIHILRSYNKDYENRQIRACNNVNSKNIETDFELVRKIYTDKQGFNVGIGYAALYFPILELLGLDTIYFGVVFDDLAFNYGETLKFNGDLKNSNFHRINNHLKNYDISIRFPLAGYSEVLTTKIADESKISNFSSCHTIGNEDSCGVCYKCFRKQGIRGKKISLKDKKTYGNITKILDKKPIKMASSTIYGIQKANYQGNYFSKFYNVDVSWCDRVNKYYNDEFGIGHISKYEFQTEHDLQMINQFVDFINNDKLYK